MKITVRHLVSAFVLVPVLLLSASSTQAEVKVPAIFGSHMVLQQGKEIPIWGWAEPEEKIQVQLGDSTVSAVADAKGQWRVELPARKASHDPLQLVIRGTNTIEISDVLIGEVWLCSGQSNMEWTVASSLNAKDEIAAANYPTIRHIKVPRVPSTTPLTNFDSTWQVCSPETAGAFTACGYFMARELAKELNVPIGLVNSSWGGTRVEPWTPPVGFQKVEALQDIYQSVIGRTPGTQQFADRLSTYVEASKAWLAEAEAALQSGTGVSAAPAFPAELTPFQSHQDPTMLYNGMIHAIVGFPIRGAIWYQGESNHAEGMLYTEKKKALIGGWRDLWGQGDFPFYYVQIAPFQYGNEDPQILARFWEAQTAVQEIPNTGMVVINDIATLNDIHPPNKQDVGHRLALLALKNDYGKSDLVASGPEFDSLETRGHQLVVRFRSTGGGLKTRDGKSPSHFEIIGNGSGGFHPANATIDGDSVILECDAVQNPVAFRFAWHKLAEPNLTGATGLPASAVRGGKVPDLISSLPDSDRYKLVYDLNLAKLSGNIQYDVDHSREVTDFDRIGYFVELDDKTILVTMNAFTDNVHHIGIPSLASGAFFQQKVESMDVFTNVGGLTAGHDIATGNIEFWPQNYGTGNAAGIPGAAGNVYDFGDEPADPTDGYGCMQVHNHAAGQTLFAINNWKRGSQADLGIGNSSGQTRDWTFTGNADSYSKKRLRVYVRTAK